MANDIKSKVKSLYEIMKEEKIQELKVNSKDYSLCIKRKDKSENKQPVISKKQEISDTSDTIVPSGISKTIPSLIETIKSPITGIFYKSSSPSAPACVDEGGIVESGKTVCVVEAMKVMNEIKAPFTAKVLKILVENGKPVNSGQDLFEIERAQK
jgi:acetyl-CoA carboxylase biotin carboxyl carrier protein